MEMILAVTAFVVCGLIVYGMMSFCVIICICHVRLTSG
mgnify:CR=1 FL=1